MSGGGGGGGTPENQNTKGSWRLPGLREAQRGSDLPQVPGPVGIRIRVFYASLGVRRGCVHRELEEETVGPTTEKVVLPL